MSVFANPKHAKLFNPTPEEQRIMEQDQEDPNEKIQRRILEETLVFFSIIGNDNNFCKLQCCYNRVFKPNSTPILTLKWNWNQGKLSPAKQKKIWHYEKDRELYNVAYPNLQPIYHPSSMHFLVNSFALNEPIENKLYLMFNGIDFAKTKQQKNSNRWTVAYKPQMYDAIQSELKSLVSQDGQFPSIHKDDIPVTGKWLEDNPIWR